jgi:leucyl aminopeptidase
MTLFPGANPEISLISDYTSKDLNRFVGKLLDKYVGVRWGYDQCGYPCSDHASWTEAGFPASFPFETRFKGHNQNIHSPRDVVNTNLSFDHGLHFAKLGLSFAVELAQ